MLVSLRFVDSYGNSEVNNINYVTVSLFITSQADFLSDPLLRISTFMKPEFRDDVFEETYFGNLFEMEAQFFCSI